MSTQENLSEVARLLALWDEEVEAMLLGLDGLAITTRYDFITHRTRAFSDKHSHRLETLIAQLQRQRAASPDT